MYTDNPSLLLLLLLLLLCFFGYYTQPFCVVCDSRTELSMNEKNWKTTEKNWPVLYVVCAIWLSRISLSLFLALPLIHNEADDRLTVCKKMHVEKHFIFASFHVTHFFIISVMPRHTAMWRVLSNPSSNFVCLCSTPLLKLQHLPTEIKMNELIAVAAAIVCYSRLTNNNVAWCTCGVLNVTNRIETVFLAVLWV